MDFMNASYVLVVVLPALPTGGTPRSSMALLPCSMLADGSPTGHSSIFLIVEYYLVA